MGSDSDLKVMSKAAVMLEELGIEYEMTIISAHREPDELIEWTRGAEDRGIKVMIAGAGMAAALPGMCAALFALPVLVYLFQERIWMEWMQCSQSCRCRRGFRLQPLRSTEQRMQQFLQQRFLQLQMKNF